MGGLINIVHRRTTDFFNSTIISPFPHLIIQNVKWKTLERLRIFPGLLISIYWEQNNNNWADWASTLEHFTIHYLIQLASLKFKRSYFPEFTPAALQL